MKKTEIMLKNDRLQYAQHLQNCYVLGYVFFPHITMLIDKKSHNEIDCVPIRNKSA